MVERGDLIFFSDQSEFAQEIGDLSPDGISHCAIYLGNNQVIDASRSNGVKVRKLEEINNEFKTKIIATPKVIDVELVIEEAMKHIGKKYNFGFYNDDDKMYCSQLVTASFNAVSDNYFPLHKLIFNTSNFWKEYYKKFGAPIPTDELGSHPGTIAQSNNLIIKFSE